MKIQYPKLLILCISVIVAYFLFRLDAFDEIANALHTKGYLSVFLGGFLFAYGFTAPFAVGFFVTLAPQVNIVVASILAGCGALISDLLIFRFIRGSFQDEFDKLKLCWFFQKISNFFTRPFFARFKRYILWVFAGFLIATPLPDEFGVSILGGFTSINKRVLGLLSFGLNTAGIFIIMLLASA